MLPLHTHGKILGVLPQHPLKVLDLPEALQSELPRELIVARSAHDQGVDLKALAHLGFAGVLQDAIPGLCTTPLPSLHSLANSAVVGAGDVIQVRPDSGQVLVLYRRRSTSHSLFITERCNSLCLMCSQPPRDVDDTWRVADLKRVITLIDRSTSTIGVTGGEPTLLREHLADLLRHARAVLPETHIHVLTNGRLFGDRSLVEMLDGLQGHVTWGIPVYADVPDVHDYVVQANGAFFETLEGIYNLTQAGHSIEIRYVLHKLTAPRLKAFAEFVGRNLPFVSHVAFMGLEPMGLAKGNRTLLWIDPADYVDELVDAVEWLERCGVPTSLYNLPLCALPQHAWHYAKRSISDWKQVYDPACDECVVRERCGGFFRSAGAAWKSRSFGPILKSGCLDENALA